MNDTLPLLFEGLLSIGLSLLILLVLNRPLAGLLERLCPDAAAAAFWRSYTQVMLTLAPLLCVLLLDLFVFSGELGAKLRHGLIASLGGLLFGLWRIGRLLARFIETTVAERSAP